MNEIKSAFYKIIQNIVRILLTLALPILAVVVSPFNNEILNFINQAPILYQFLIAALVGGYLFTPAHNIGDLSWQIIRSYFREAIGAPKMGENPYSARTLTFQAKERHWRRAGWCQLLGQFAYPAAKTACVLATALSIILTIMYLIVLISTPSIDAILNFLVAISIFTAISFIVLFAFALIIPIIGIKLYYHN